MSSADVDAFVKEYVKELHAETAAVFVGAGLSAPAGFVDWVGLLQPLAASLGLDAEQERDHLVMLAQYHVNANQQNRSALHKRMLDEFPSHADPAENHRLLARLPLRVFWTTNYDRLIERSIEQAGKIVDVKHRVDQLAFTKPRRSATVFKMHGDVEHPADAVVTKDDYEKYPTKRGAFANALSGDLVSKTFLFLGFSFKDPNLDYVLSRIRVAFQENARQHYCIFKRVDRKVTQSQAEFEYAAVKQRLAIEDLKRFNIKTILVDSYEQVTEILRRVERAYRRRTVFVSGSAEEFGDWSREAASEFLYELGKLVIVRGYRLVSGLGWGISNDLLSGAIEQIYAQRIGQIHDHLMVRPFPRYVKDPDRRDALWSQFRHDLIAQAGVALFIFGNKREQDATVLADGVRKEYEIAEKLDLVTLPVGATGYVAEELWLHQAPTISGGDLPHAFKEAFSQLNQQRTSPQQLLARVSTMLEQLSTLNR